MQAYVNTGLLEERTGHMQVWAIFPLTYSSNLDLLRNVKCRCFCAFSMLPIHWFICGAPPQYQHWPPHIVFRFLKKIFLLFKIVIDFLNPSLNPPPPLSHKHIYNGPVCPCTLWVISWGVFKFGWGIQSRWRTLKILMFLCKHFRLSRF